MESGGARHESQRRPRPLTRLAAAAYHHTWERSHKDAGPPKGSTMRHVRILSIPVTLVASVCVGVLLAQLPARAVPADPPAAGVTANATHFDGLGSPYGGCGMPQSELETQDFVALNVYNTPRDYSFVQRPIPDAQASKIGIWNNGHNCGRWVKVTIGDFCTGTNDGAPNQAFCRNGSFVSDAYNGATLNMLVADSCGDANAWCRDDPYHLDLGTASINRFLRNGVPVGDLNPNHWNNRHISWSFIPAPNYTGDIQIGFLAGAQRFWPAISVSRLPNGIHGVEFFAGGTWQSAQMDSDMGQAFIIGGTTSGGTDFQIRVRDANDALVGGGRVYSFSLPASCGSQCSPAYTKISYTTGTGPTPTPTPPTPTPTPTQNPAGGCTVTSAVTSSWATGFVQEFTVTNRGTAPTTGWTVNLAFPASLRVTNSWNALLTTAGGQIAAANQTYNAVLQPGGTATWGMSVEGGQPPAGTPTCTTR